MSFDEYKDFDQNMNHLIRLLKKMIKNLPHLSQGPGPMPKFSKSKDGDIHVNFCFFNFMPMSAEDLEEIDEIYEQYLAEEEKAERSDLSPELNASDLEFLRRLGIR